MVESRFQTSFIPKKPIETGRSSVQANRRTPDLFRVIAVVVFLISLLLWGGVFLWKVYLNSKINSATQSLAASQKEFDLTTVTTLTRLNNRLTAAENLIANHLALSKLFNELEAVTVKDVRFSDLSLLYAGTDKGITLTLKGQAVSYADVAKQSDYLLQNRDFRSPIFSDLNLDQNGRIIFTINTSLDPRNFFYTVNQANSASSSAAGATNSSTPANNNSASPFQ